MSDDRVWQVQLPDGSTWIPADSRPGDPRASWIYARSTADMFAQELGGKVVEVTRRQKERLLDEEISTALSKPIGRPRAAKSRPLGRSAKRAIATAILENVAMTYPVRSAIVTAREAGDDATYKRALRTLQAGLPAALWVGYDADTRRGFAQEAEPVWTTADPQGEDPKAWRQIDRDQIAMLLVEDAP
ncbi:MAG TPA: hypothetical protein VLE97_11715 [Gaiellaceae bacterium]|nr:hypothetical protein [Gaiellaceae bacterium]